MVKIDVIDTKVRKSITITVENYVITMHGVAVHCTLCNNYKNASGNIVGMLMLKEKPNAEEGTTGHLTLLYYSAQNKNQILH